LSCSGGLSYDLTLCHHLYHRLLGCVCVGDREYLWIDWYVKWGISRCMCFKRDYCFLNSLIYVIGWRVFVFILGIWARGVMA